MTELLVYGVPVTLDDNIRLKEGVPVARKLVLERLKRPIGVSATKKSKKLQVKFIPKSKEKQTEAEFDSIPVDMKFMKGRIYALNNVTTSDIGEEQIEAAHRLWREHMFLEKNTRGKVILAAT